MRVDLHCHSTVSDGSRTPSELAGLAAAREVALFCLTDHDSADGYPATAERLGAARARRGVELSCREAGGPVHLLLYDRGGGGWARIADELVALKEARRHRVRDIAARLEQLGFRVDAEAILRGAGVRAVGRPDVARALVASGQMSSVREAFNRLLHDGGPGDVPIRRLGVGDGLELARAGGCRVALAHPHQLGASAAHQLVRRYRDAGLDGIEAYYAIYDRGERRSWVALARTERLVVTAGSDYHGDVLPQVTTVGVDLPEELARPLCDWLEVEVDGSDGERSVRGGRSHGDD